MIRKAKLNDAPAIQQLISLYAEKGQMLYRSLEDVRRIIDDFYVYAEAGKILGTCCLNRSWDKVVELRSLAVHPDHFHRGIASALIRKCIAKSSKSPDKEIIFVLTYVVSLFRKLGFEVVEKDSLPLKVWNDCRACPKRDHCDEIAMSRMLRPAAAARKPGVDFPLKNADKVLY